jgi:hypothetical protein
VAETLGRITAVMGLPCGFSRRRARAVSRNGDPRGCRSWSGSGGKACDLLGFDGRVGRFGEDERHRLSGEAAPVTRRSARAAAARRAGSRPGRLEKIPTMSERRPISLLTPPSEFVGESWSSARAGTRRTREGLLSGLERLAVHPTSTSTLPRPSAERPASWYRWMSRPPFGVRDAWR